MKLLLPSVAILCGLSAAAATINCAPDTAANYIANGTCAESPFILKNFDWSSSSLPGFVHVAPSQVFLIPSTSAGVFGLSFQGAPGIPNPFNISGTQKIDANFDYTIDPRPPILKGLTVALNSNSPSGGGFATITTRVCAGDTFADSCLKGTDFGPIVVQDFGHGNPNNIFSVNVDFPTGVSILDIRMIIDMQANGGISEITGGGTAALTDTPEPASAGLALAGIASLLIVRRRRQA